MESTKENIAFLNFGTSRRYTRSILNYPTLIKTLIPSLPTVNHCTINWCVCHYSYLCAAPWHRMAFLWTLDALGHNRFCRGTFPLGWTILTGRDALGRTCITNHTSASAWSSAPSPITTSSTWSWMATTRAWSVCDFLMRLLLILMRWETFFLISVKLCR